MEKNFFIKIDLSYDMVIPAETYEEAVLIVKETFENEHRIVLSDDEITNGEVE